MSFNIILILLSLIPLTVEAKTYSAFLGVGGEPNGPTTMFDPEVELMGKVSKSVGGEVISSLNGGHKKTEEKIQRHFNVPNTPFIEENFLKIISDYEKKIESGDIKADDQLMLVINTHGAVKYNEKTHQIAMSGAHMTDLDSGAGARTVSLDKLEKLTELAEKHGVKLAIIDLSCHSGNTIPLKNSKTCVITSSGPNHYGYGGNSTTFPHNFFNRMKKGKNLEEVFLEARAKTEDHSFPMISTPAGLKVNQDLYEPLSPFLFYKYDNADKLSGFIKEEAKNENECKLPEYLNTLQDLITETRTLTAPVRSMEFTSSEAKKLRKALQEYYEVQTKIREGYKSFNLPDLEVKEKFCSDERAQTIVWKNNRAEISYTLKPLCIEYTVDEILSADLEWSIEFHKKNFNREHDYYWASLKNFEQIKRRREELSKTYPDIVKRNKYFDESNLVKKTYKYASDVAQASTHLYDALYHQISVREQTSNPCRDFVL